MIPVSVPATAIPAAPIVPVQQPIYYYCYGYPTTADPNAQQPILVPCLVPMLPQPLLFGSTPPIVNPASLKKMDPESVKLARQRRMEAAYKTEMCRALERPEGCLFGFNCFFAHSEAELRPRKKTALCRNFVLTGQCPLGDGCHFIHKRKHDESSSSSSSAATTESSGSTKKTSSGNNIVLHDNA